jgi:DNA topoisomerase-1
MGKKLVIVESPAKARTINRILGGEYEVKASMGHVRDLPKNKLAVDIENDFAPTYEVLRDKKKVVSELKRAVKDAEAVYLAADPDREGESICFHLEQLLDGRSVPFFRVVFNEITTPAVKRAFEQPGAIDTRKVEAQQARRILDRLVGYQISPLLWRRVKTGLSAGRVQSVALRLIVDRENEIRAFVSEEFWKITARLLGRNEPPFIATLTKRDGEKLELRNSEETGAVADELRALPYRVKSIQIKPRKRNPPQPFITSTLQQEAFRRLKFSVKRTMALAQQLYEGVSLGEEGSVALITYMRTDSTRISTGAQQAVRDFISHRFGSDYLPAHPPKPKKVKAAQEAHEAIRPTRIERTPESLQGKIDPAQLRLYTLIWNRFVTSQMEAAVFQATTVDVEAGRYGLRATGNHLLFDGWLAVAGRPEDEEEAVLPALSEGEELKLLELTPAQFFTQPPPRFSEASLVRELEERGIGRPSTYAQIIGTILTRDYVRRDQGRLTPTDLGEVVTELLVDNFNDILDYDYTARMEGELDKIEDGEEEWVGALRRFNERFSKDLADAEEKMRNIRREVTPTDIKCDICGAGMVIRWGRFGKFLSCSRYPECKNAKPMPDSAAEARQREIEEMAAKIGAQVSDVCGTPLILRRGRFGLFLGCSRFPKCRYTVPVKKDGTISWEKAKKQFCAEMGVGEPEKPKKTRRGKTGGKKSAGGKKSK